MASLFKKTLLSGSAMPFNGPRTGTKDAPIFRGLGKEMNECVCGIIELMPRSQEGASWQDGSLPPRDNPITFEDEIEQFVVIHFTLVEGE